MPIDMAADFRLLGAVEVWLGGRPVDIGHARRQCVLAVLLHDANRTVSQDQLVDRVWGNGRLPGRPLNAVQTYVSLLRRALAPVPQVNIALRSAGYQLSVDPEAVDVHRFRALIAKARTAADSLASALYEQALTLWRGEPFATLDTPWLATARAKLLSERYAAELDLSDVQMRLGRHSSLLSDLAARAAEHPLDERAVGQLMLALYRCGRTADALEQYRRTRQRFADELGTDPSVPLKELHSRMLAADPALTAPVGQPTLVVPRQLPAQPNTFTGRTRELSQVDNAVAADGMAVVAISGVAGVGKTWLASLWSHRNVDRFPDGQLYVDLRGFGPGEPTPSMVVVRGFLDALGVHPDAIPADPDAQTALYRSVVLGRRMLIVLDNARDAAQVVPLLPGGASCVVLVTSRRQLADLVARHGARPLRLDLLNDVEAAELFASHLGRDWAAGEAEPVSELLACCAGLPLAISNVATRATLRPDFSLAVFADELRDVSSRLDALDEGELATNVRTVLSWSYNALDNRSAGLFRLLGLVADVDLLAIAALAGLPVSRTRIVLRELESAHLVQQLVPGRYQMHDLIRLYAAERAEREDLSAVRVAALRRLVDQYLGGAFVADQVLDPHRLPAGLAEPAAPVPVRSLDSQAAAVAWFTAEHRNLLAAQRIAAEHGWFAAVCALAWTLETWHRRGGHINDAVAVWQLGVEAAARLEDQALVAVALRLLGTAYARAGRYTKAFANLHEALVLSEASDDLLGRAHAHHLMAGAWDLRREDRQALDHASRALPLFAELELPVWQAWALDQIGWHEAQLGDYEQARAHCELALALARDHHDREGEAVTLDSLGYISFQTGQYPEAVARYREALNLFRELADTYEEAITLDRLAEALHALGDVAQATAAWLQALDLCRSQHRTAEASRIQQRLDGVITGTM